MCESSWLHRVVLQFRLERSLSTKWETQPFSRLNENLACFHKACSSELTFSTAAAFKCNWSNIKIFLHRLLLWIIPIDVTNKHSVWTNLSAALPCLLSCRRISFKMEGEFKVYFECRDWLSKQAVYSWLASMPRLVWQQTTCDVSLWLHRCSEECVGFEWLLRRGSGSRAAGCASVFSTRVMSAAQQTRRSNPSRCSLFPGSRWIWKAYEWCRDESENTEETHFRFPHLEFCGFLDVFVIINKVCG